MTISIACALCGKRFTPTRPDAKTCSVRCRVGLHRRSHPQSKPQPGLDKALSAILHPLQELALRTGVTLNTYLQEGVTYVLAKHKVVDDVPPPKKRKAPPPKMTKAELAGKLATQFEAARHVPSITVPLSFREGTTQQMPTACGFYRNKSIRIELRMLANGTYIGRFTGVDGAVTHKKLNTFDAHKIQKQSDSVKLRRERINALHPDKLGRPQTPEEKEEFNFYVRQGRNTKITKTIR